MNKLSTLSRMGLLILLLNGYLCLTAQVAEPNNFDWKESYDMTTKQEVFYDEDLVSNIPEDAMFWVQILPKVKKTRESIYSKDGNMIFERSKVLEQKMNGENYNHGYVEMIRADGKSFFTLQSSPQNFIENSNVSNPMERPSGPLFSPGLSFRNIEQNIQGDGWIPVYVNGKIWYRNVKAEIEINVDASSGLISSRDLETATISYDKYEEVEPNIWRNTFNVEIVPEVTIEGYCIERRTTTTKNNFSFDINNAGQDARISKDVLSNSNLVEVKQDAGELIVKRVEQQTEFDLLVYDVMGRVVYTGNSISDERINFSPSVSGIYFIAFIQNGVSEVTKLYLH